MPWFRKLLVIGITALVGLGLVVLLLPTLLSLGIGRNLVAGRIERYIEGSASIEQIKLSWWGGQSVRGLQLRRPDGRLVADIDATAGVGLFKLLRGSVDAYPITLAGTLEAELGLDGGLSFIEAASERPSTSPAAPIQLPPVPVTVDVDGLVVDIVDVVADRTETFERIRGRIEYAPARAVRVDLEADCRCAQLSGVGELHGTFENLFDAHGRLSLEGADADLRLTIEKLPLPRLPDSTWAERLQLTVTSNDIGQRFTVLADADLVVEGEPGRLTAELLGPGVALKNGAIDVDWWHASGTIDGHRVPISMFQPLVLDTPVVLARDIGPIVDLQVSVDIGETHTVNATISAEALNLELEGTVDTQLRRFEGSRVSATAELHPQLLHALGASESASPVRVETELSRLVLPWTEDDRLDLEAIGFTGSASTERPLLIDLGVPMAIRQLEMTMDCVALGAGVETRIELLVDGEPATLEGVLAPLDESQRLNLRNWRPIGQLTLNSLPPALTQWLNVDPLVAQEIFGAHPVTTLRAERDGDDGYRIQLTCEGGQSMMSAVAVEQGHVVRISEGEGRFRITPSLVTMLSSNPDNGISLAADTMVEIRFDPLTLTRTDETPYRAGDESLGFSMRMDDAELSGGRTLVEPIGLQGLVGRGRIGATETGSHVSIDGNVKVTRLSVASTIGRAKIDVEFVDLGTRPRVSGAVQLADVSTADLEALLGVPAGRWEGWVGPGGDVAIGIDEPGAQGITRIQLDLDLTSLQGQLTIDATADRVIVPSGSVTATLSADHLTALLFAPAADGTGQPPRRVIEPCAAKVTIRDLSLPYALLRNQPFEPASVTMDLAIDADRLVLEHDSHTFTVSDLHGSFRCTTPGAPADVAFIGQVQRSGSDGPPGRIETRGTIVHSIGEQSLHEAEFALTSSATQIQTDVLDDMAGLGGLLIAAVGPTMDGTMDITRRADGVIDCDLQLTTSQGTAHGRAQLHPDDLLTFPGNQAIELQLTATPELSQGVLGYVHPALRDIRSTTEPMRFTISHGEFPVNGDLTRLNADIELQIGDARFDAQSTIFAPMELFADLAAGAVSPDAQEAVRTVPGNVPPILVSIRSGVITYDKFTIRMGNQDLDYTGTIDLVNGTLNIRTHVPVLALGPLIRNIPFLPSSVVVPVETKGSFDDPTTRVLVAEAIGDIPGGILDGLTRPFRPGPDEAPQPTPDGP